ncbi:uncharacterized protein LOC112521931 [Cynara cardunculus var. scolymus]|uniref:FLZ-type domain-containing protein n=1 Tax=Cynara cardunculus var. scolymus TaxID=59895 RepID=A0A103XFK5_CYNCS|nr:uncharacterized protein LOC112521931 [Cynara cardunculus var. scolymus]KVH89747.1 Protein of unknown function DUF581 [Cynara cardunculus var. scolymus]
MESTSTRKPCFLEDDNGLASIAANHGFFSSPENHHNHLLSRPLCSPKPRNIYASLSHVSSPRSGRGFNGRFEDQQPYFLDACFLCKKLLDGNTDIFMYRGDTAFCSEECRREQIDDDEDKEKKWSVSVSMRSLRKKEENEKQPNASSPNKTSKNYPFQSGAVAAA